MALDFSDIDKILDRCLFYTIIDFNDEEDLAILQKTIDSINENSINNRR